MKKKIIVLALIVLLMSGCGSKIPTLSNGDEAVVTLKNGSMISVNELYEAVKDDYALTAMIDLVDLKILEDKYKNKLDEVNSNVDAQITQLQAIYGDTLEDTIKQQTSYKSLEEYKEALYLAQLKELAILDYCKAQIKDKEIEKYYDENIVGDIKVSHILITPAVTDAMTDEEKKEAEAEAKEKAETIISELKKTDSDKVEEKFAELAAEHSMDEATKDNGGSLGFINKDTLSSSYDELVTAAYELKDGKYSTKIITTELGYHIILRTESKEKAALEDVKEEILDTLASEYLTKNQVASVRGLQEVRDEYDFEIVDTELKAQYAEYIQSSLDYYTKLDNQTTTTTK